MIQKKEKKEKRKKDMGFGSKLRALYHPPLHSTQTHTPLCLRDTSPCSTPPLCPLMEVPPIPPGNQALAAAISRAKTPRHQEPPFPSPSAQPSPPLAFLAEVFSETRKSLQLNPDLVQDLSPHPLQTITAGEGSILSILCATVCGIVAITTQLYTVNTQLSEFRKENQELRTKIHDLSSMVANEVPTHEDIRPLHSALRDLSHHVTTTALTDRPRAPTSHPTAPTASPQRLPMRGQPTAPSQPIGLAPQPCGPSHALPLARPAPHPPQENIDPSKHCPFYITKLKKMFGNPELYANSLPRLLGSGKVPG